MNPLNHQALVHYVARKWLKSFEKAAVSIDYNDLVQEAFMVFIYASKKFDPTKGWAFSTYFNVASNPPKEVKEQFAAVEAKRKVASSMGIDKRYPLELNLNFVASIMAVTGVAASDLSKAKEEVKRLELDYAV